MRRAILIAILGVALVAPASALAGTSSASAGGVTATLSWSGGPGITTKDERLTITQTGQPKYDQPVPATGCFKLCTPQSNKPVQVADLYGDGSEEVVLNLFSGGADCCTIEQVYVQSAALGSYTMNQRNFGAAGVVLKDIGPHGRAEMVSANGAFYCQFSACYASGLPIQIFEFNDWKFIDVTKQYPTLIAADAAKWLKLYNKHLGPDQGLIATWAADEDNLGVAEQAVVRTSLQHLVAEGHLSSTFVKSLNRLLAKHHYT
jgi:hypothetical protein